MPAAPFSGLTVDHGPGDPVGDLFALAGCDRVIGPPSTFSQWAAFFGDVPICFLDEGKPLAPDRFSVSDLSVIP